MNRIGHVTAIAAFVIGAVAGPAIAGGAPYVGAEAPLRPIEAADDVPFTVLGSGDVDPAERYLVQFENDSSRDRARFSLLGKGLNPADVAGQDTLVLAVDATASEIDELEQTTGVVAVEPEQQYELLTDQPSPTWGLDRIDQRNLPLDSTYSYDATGDGVVIYVIDSGIWFTHSEFAGRIPYYAFWDFGDGLDGWDCHGHGTHVAGTAAGTTYGVAKEALIVPVKVAPCASTTSTTILLQAMDWIVNDHALGTPAVVNISIGGPPSSIVDSAVQAMIDDGMTVVAAAGNEAGDSCLSSPGRLGTAITVAASTRDDDDAWFSNYGPCNDIFAPGTEILSAGVGWDSATQIMDGTSMAAPHVAGAAAIILQDHPSYSPAQVWAALDSLATVGALTECCGDPDKLLHLPPTTAEPPSGASISLGSVTTSSMEATFSADAGGGSNTYTLTVWMWTPGAGGAVVRSLADQASPVVIGNLTPGTAYSVSVTADNGVAPAANAEAFAMTLATPVGPPADPRQAAFDEFAATPGLHRGHSTILRLYWAVFARIPDVGGSVFWVDAYDSGEWSVRRIARHFAVSAEFVDTYGAGLSDEEFTLLIYRNVLERDPDSAGFAFWVGQLAGGMERAEMILLMSNDFEFIEEHPLPGDLVADTGPRG